MAVPAPENTILSILEGMGSAVAFIIRFGGLALILVFAGVGVYWYFILRKKKRINQIEVLRRRHMDIARRERQTTYPYLKQLWRIPIDLKKIPNGNTEEMKKTLAHNNAVYVGEITGFNIINRLASSKDIVGNLTRGKNLTDEERKSVMDTVDGQLKKLGSKYFIINYRQFSTAALPISKKTSEHILIIPENHTPRYHDRVGGTVLVEGYGINSLGNFDVLSGQSFIYPFLIAELQAMAYTEMIVNMVGNIQSLVDKGIGLDSDMKKYIQVGTAIGTTLRPPMEK